MIETADQAQKALKQIKRKTKWSMRRIAEKLEVNHTTIWHMSKGHIDCPSQAVMDSIDALLTRVKG